MKVTNDLELEMFRILEGHQTSVCVKLKGDVSFLLEKAHDGVLQLTNLTMKIMRFSFAKQCGKQFFLKKERWVSQLFVQ